MSSIKRNSDNNGICNVDLYKVHTSLHHYTVYTELTPIRLLYNHCSYDNW